MAEQHRFQIRVVGEGKPRVSGVLAFVLPQALDLASTTSYVVSIRPAGLSPDGFLRFRRNSDGLDARYERNVNKPLTPATHKIPAWCEQAISMSRELGRKVTWQPQNPT